MTRCDDREDDAPYHGEGMGDKDPRVIRQSGTANEAAAVPALTASVISSAETTFSLTPKT